SRAARSASGTAGGGGSRSRGQVLALLRRHCRTLTEPPMASGFRERLQERLQARRAAQLYRTRREVQSPQSAVLQVDGRELLNFCSNDYLGLANDPRVKEAFIAGVERYGAGSGASHLVCGHSAPHEALENALAEFTGRSHALVYSSGFMANVGVLTALLGPQSAVFEDRLNHASLLDGGLF